MPTMRRSPYVAGADYYALGDAARRKLGLPRIDTRMYARDNGLAIAAYVSLYEATHDAGALDTAVRAARRILETHSTERGAVTHEEAAGPDTRVYLADNAAFGLALVRVYEATHDAAVLARAERLAEALVGTLYDSAGGGFWSGDVTPNAVGVFAVRHKPVEENVMALRFLARLAKNANADRYRAAIAKTLVFVATPDRIRSRGRMVGDFLLAFEETRGVR